MLALEQQEASPLLATAAPSLPAATKRGPPPGFSNPHKAPGPIQPMRALQPIGRPNIQPIQPIHSISQVNPINPISAIQPPQPIQPPRQLQNNNPPQFHAPGPPPTLAANITGPSLESFLAPLGLLDLLPVLEAEEIDVEALPLLGEPQFRALGIKLGPSLKIMRAAKVLFA